MPNTPRSIAAEAISTPHATTHEDASDNCMPADDAASLFEMPASKRLRPMDAMEATPLLSDDLFEDVIADLSTSEGPSYEMSSSDAISDGLSGHFQPYSPSLTSTEAYPLSTALTNSRSSWVDMPAPTPAMAPKRVRMRMTKEEKEEQFMAEPLFKELQERLRNDRRPLAAPISEQLKDLHRHLSRSYLERRKEPLPKTQGPCTTRMQDYRFYWIFSLRDVSTAVEQSFAADALLKSAIQANLTGLSTRTIRSQPLLALLHRSIETYLSFHHTVSTEQSMEPRPQTANAEASLPLYEVPFAPVAQAEANYGDATATALPAAVRHGSELPSKADLANSNAEQIMEKPLFSRLQNDLEQYRTPRAARISEQLDRLHTTLAYSMPSSQNDMLAQTASSHNRMPQRPGSDLGFSIKRLNPLVEKAFPQDPFLASYIQAKLIKATTIDYTPFIALLGDSIHSYLAFCQTASNGQSMVSFPTTQPFINRPLHLHERRPLGLETRKACLEEPLFQGLQNYLQNHMSPRAEPLFQQLQSLHESLGNDAIKIHKAKPPGKGKGISATMTQGHRFYWDFWRQKASDAVKAVFTADPFLGATIQVALDRHSAKSIGSGLLLALLHRSIEDYLSFHRAASREQSMEPRPQTANASASLPLYQGPFAPVAQEEAADRQGELVSTAPPAVSSSQPTSATESWAGRIAKERAQGPQPDRFLL